MYCDLPTRLIPKSVKLLKSESSRRFSYFAPHTWNALTIPIRESDCMQIKKKKVSQKMMIPDLNALRSGAL